MALSKMPINQFLSPRWALQITTVYIWFHHTVHVFKRGREITKNIKMWTEEATLTLQGCLDSTAWEEFTESSGDMDELTDLVKS